MSGEDQGRQPSAGPDSADSGETPKRVEVIDLDLDQQGETTPARTKSATVAPKLVPYDPNPHRDKMRGRLAMTLVSTLTGTIAGALTIVAFAPTRIEAVSELLGAILGPLVALVGAATGYYFGAREQPPIPPPE